MTNPVLNSSQQVNNSCTSGDSEQDHTLEVVYKTKQLGYLNGSNYWITHFKKNEPLDAVFCYKVYKNVSSKSFE